MTLNGVRTAIGADLDSLAQVVREATGTEVVDLRDWRADEVGTGRAGNPTSGGIYRVSGTAETDGAGPARWSIILKVLRRVPGLPVHTDAPDSPICWRREIDLARSGLLDAVAGIASPRCFAIVDQPDETAWLWFEDLGEVGLAEWGARDYAVAAAALARFHARSLAVADEVDLSWLDREPFTTFLALHYGPMVQRVLDLARHAPAGSALGALDPGRGPEELRPVLELMADPSAALAALDLVPRTLIHNDFNPDNLRLRTRPDGEVEVVAFDWQMVSLGPVSADLGQLLSYLPDRLGTLTRDQVEQATIDAYVRAAAESGAPVDRAAVLTAYRADAAVRQVLFSAAFLCEDLERALASGDDDAVAALVRGWAQQTTAGPLPGLARRAAAELAAQLGRPTRRPRLARPGS